jgi:hypothetical protein
MKKIFILLLFPFLYQCQSTNIDCKDIKEGLFRIESVDGSLHTIVRTKDKQRENVGRTGLISEFDLKWTSDCSYILYNRKVIRGKDNMPSEFKIDTLYNKITEVNGDSHKVISSIKDYDFKAESVLIKYDTTKLHRTLSELEKFKNYSRESNSGTLISDKYSISYTHNINDKTDYLIALQEVLSIGGKSKYKLLDFLFFKLDSKQRLRTTNCRFNEKYDREIVAIYISENDNEEAKIIKAWRFNRESLKIETVDINKVKYKVADKDLFIWN